MRRPIFNVFAVIILGSHSLSASSQSTDIDIIDTSHIVLTPTRLRQPIAEVPGSVTVITAEMLERYGITSLPEALRLVPGMALTQLSGGEYAINYHGGNVVAPRRMNLLIDGRSAYRSARAEIDWSMLPVAIGDVERIEVARGPNSASYGPNSMLAIVNVITKHPNDSAVTTIGATAGSRDTRTASARHGGKLGQATRFWLTADHRQTAGLAHVGGPNFTLPGGDASHDSSRRDLLSFRSSTEIDEQSLELRFATLKGKQDFPLVDQYQKSYPDVMMRQHDLSMTWRKNISPKQAVEITASKSTHSNDQPWTICLPALAYLPELGKLWKANPDYVLAIIAGRIPAGGTQADNLLAASALKAIRGLGAKAVAPACGVTDQNFIESRSDLEVQSTTVFSERLRTVAGLGGRRDVADSETYLWGKVSNNSWRVFLNAEYRPMQNVVINTGGYYERDTLTGASFSPRLAVNRHLDPNNTIRLVVSRAGRMPGIIEQRTKWSYTTRGIDPNLLGVSEARYAQSATSPGNLVAEKNTSREIGYVGNFPELGLMIDARLFDDHMTDLISERLSLLRYIPTNSNSLRHRGVELQVDYAPALKWNVHMGYTYQDASATTSMDLTQYSRNSGLIAISHEIADDFTISVTAHQNQGSPNGQSPFGRQDITLTKRLQLGRSSLLPSLTVTHLDQTEVRYFYDVGKSRTNRIGEKLQVQASVKVTF
jgi:iron complex outermembrane receptor protein